MVVLVWAASREKERTMTVRLDDRGRWLFRFQYKLTNGVKKSIYGVPGALGTPYQDLPNTKQGAKHAEALARTNIAKPEAQVQTTMTLGDFVDSLYTKKMATVGNAKGVNKPSVLDT